MGRKKKYINIFGSFKEPFNCRISVHVGEPKHAHVWWVFQENPSTAVPEHRAILDFAAAQVRDLVCKMMHFLTYNGFYRQVPHNFFTPKAYLHSSLTHEMMEVAVETAGTL